MSDSLPRLLDEKRVEVRLVEVSTHVLNLFECTVKRDHLNKAISLLESGKSEEKK